MNRIESMNGYTIYQAGARDVTKYGFEDGSFYVYFSSDVRDFGLANSTPEYEGCGSLEEAVANCCGNYARAKEIVEGQTTAASFEEIAEIERRLDAIRKAAKHLAAGDRVDDWGFVQAVASSWKAEAWEIRAAIETAEAPAGNPEELPENSYQITAAPVVQQAIHRNFYADKYNPVKVWEIVTLSGGLYVRQYIAGKQFGRRVRMSRQQITGLGLSCCIFPVSI